jgi:hypothetical protein
VVALLGRPKFTMTTEGYYSMHMHVLVLFGRWHDIVTEPLPAEPDLYPVTTAMLHYAKHIAFATLKLIAEAEEERRTFREAVQHLPAGRRLLSNDAREDLGVTEKCSTVNLSIIRAMSRKPSTICTRACDETTTSATLSRGPGCIRRDMRWRRCRLSRNATRRWRRCTATISA